MRARTILILALLAASLPAGAEEPLVAQAEGEHGHHGGTGQAAPTEITRAVAVLVPTDGNSVQGVITFTREGDGVRVHGQITGLSPGTHGFHVHDYGDCSAPDGASAGPHFNPTQDPHAAPEASDRHIGDLGNIEAGEDGSATYDRVDAMLSFDGPTSIIGRGLIVHADPDDLTSQPSGAAGARQACGVIGVAAAEAAAAP